MKTISDTDIQVLFKVMEWIEEDLAKHIMAEQDPKALTLLKDALDTQWDAREFLRMLLESSSSRPKTGQWI